VPVTPTPAVPPFGVALSARVAQVLTPAVLAVAHRRLQRKAGVISAWLVVSYAAVLTVSSTVSGVVACVSLALALAGVGFNIGHDANHNALFSTGGQRRLTTANRLAGLAMNVIGADAGRWLSGHVRRHHSAPNVAHHDDDIDLAPFGRLAPTQGHRPWYRFQHLYLWPLYTVTAAAVFVTDMTSTVGECVRGDDQGRRPSAATVAKMAASKLLFLAVMVGVPASVHTSASVVTGVIGTAAFAGLLLGIVFQLAHTVEGAAFRDVDDPEPSRWHEWQVRATVDFCHGPGPVARAVTWFIGGLNYQVEHHLFPSVPHTAYPALVPAVADVCAEHGLVHQVQPTLRAAVASHHRHLRAMGRPPTRRA
jgi:linoleoyl-CoA desaturase